MALLYHKVGVYGSLYWGNWQQSLVVVALGSDAQMQAGPDAAGGLPEGALTLMVRVGSVLDPVTGGDVCRLGGLGLVDLLGDLDLGVALGDQVLRV